MTLQMNETALLASGYVFKGEYIMFRKWYIAGQVQWDVYTARCFQEKADPEQCIVKTAHNRRHGFTHEFYSKQQANAYIKRLLSEGYKMNKKAV